MFANIGQLVGSTLSVGISSKHFLVSMNKIASILSRGLCIYMSFFGAPYRMHVASPKHFYNVI